MNKIINNLKRKLLALLIFLMMLTNVLSNPIESSALSVEPKIISGYNHTLILKSDGTVLAWGQNNYGQLGIGNTIDQLSPVIIPELTNVKQVVVGNYQTFALMEDGTVKAWGYNLTGQLGIENKLNQYSPITVPNLINVKQIASGSDHVLALLEDGTVKSWGINYSGQLGIGNTTFKTTPTIVSGLTNVKQIKAGAYHSLALLEDGTVKVWGDNDSGELGIGNTISQKSPILIPGLSNVKQIEAGIAHSLVLHEDGTVKGWGENGNGQITASNLYDKLSPVIITGLINVKQLAGGQNHSLALLEDGTIYIWGYNQYGQLGIEDLPTNMVTQKRIIPDIANVNQITAGSSYTAVLLDDGTVKTWGQNNYGQLGIGNTDNQLSPVIVPDLIIPQTGGNTEELNIAKNAVIQTEASKLQTDLDSARVLVNALPTGSDKVSLTNRLNIVQAYIDYQEAVRIATLAVEKAEITILQSDVDSARVLINVLVNPEKADLTTRLDVVDYVINCVIDATLAVEKAETTKLQADVDSARTLVNALNNSISQKASLLTRLNDLQIAIINKQIQDLIDRIDEILTNPSAEELTELEDIVNDLDDLINQLPNSAEKDEILATQILRATEAVVKAENSKTQIDVDSAKILVNTLPNITEKSLLSERLDTVQAIIDTKNELQQAIANATSAVVKTENSKLQADVNSARALVDALPQITEKTSLTERLNTVQSMIDIEKELQQAIANATNAVVKAEGSKLQADVDSARVLVNALPNITEKTSLHQRLDAVQLIIDNPEGGETNAPEAIRIAEMKVKIAETYKRNPYVTNAEDTVNALYDSPEKTALLDRLEALKALIEENTLAQELKNATTKVKIAETYKREPYISTARDVVNALVDSPEKEALDDRLNAISPSDGSESSSTTVKFAIIAVTRAEKTPTKYTIQYAIKKVNMIADSTPEKADLLQRVEILKINYNNLIAEKNSIVQIENATNYVNYAEKYKSTYYFNKAQTLVSSLENGEIKTTLQGRLDILQSVIFPSAETIAMQEATKAVEKAENYKIEAYIQKAKMLVDALVESHEKTDLTNRLNLIVIE
jgi:alpha-tubulin suppressor-like RCC1 family protein